MKMHNVIKQKDSFQTYRFFKLIFPEIQFMYEKIRILFKRFRYLMYVYEKVLFLPEFHLTHFLEDTFVGLSNKSVKYAFLPFYFMYIRILTK